MKERRGKRHDVETQETSYPFRFAARADRALEGVGLPDVVAGKDHLRAPHLKLPNIGFQLVEFGQAVEQMLPEVEMRFSVDGSVEPIQPLFILTMSLASKGRGDDCAPSGDTQTLPNERQPDLFWEVLERVHTDGSRKGVVLEGQSVSAAS